LLTVRSAPVQLVAQLAPTGNVHVAALMPSHAPPHPVMPPHARRPPRGAPVIAAQVPFELGSLHTSHWPGHAALQQTPSTQ
jgi:hypothetical protein